MRKRWKPLLDQSVSSLPELSPALCSYGCGVFLFLLILIAGYPGGEIGKGINEQKQYLSVDRSKTIHLPEENLPIEQNVPQRQLAAMDDRVLASRVIEEDLTLKQYLVQNEDRVGTIARSFGLRPESLISLNRLNSPDDLYPGQTLYIPPWDGVRVTLGRREIPLSFALNHQIEAGKYIALRQERTYFMPLPIKNSSYWDHSFRMPLDGPVIQDYGLYKDPLTAVETNHSGVDLAGEKGESVLSVEKGRVVEAGIHSFYGRYLILSHPRGYQSFYGHLESFLVKEGDEMRKGEVLGIVGNSGQAQQIKLHFSLFLDEKTVDPLEFLY